MTAVTIAIAMTGFVGACNVAVVMWGSATDGQARGRKNGEENAESPYVKDVVWLAVRI